MVKTVESVSEVTEQNTAATQQMTASSDGVKDSVESIATITEQSSAAAQEMSASSEEVGAQVQQVVASSQGLAEMAAALRNTVARFRLSDDDSALADEPSERKPEQMPELQPEGAA